MLAAAAPYLLAVDFMAFLCDLAKSTKMKTKLKFGTVFFIAAIIVIHFAESLMSETDEVIFEIIKIALFTLKGMSINVIGTAINVVSSNWLMMNITIFTVMMAAAVNRFAVSPFMVKLKQKNNYEPGIFCHQKWLPDHSYLNLKKNLKGCFS